MIYTLTLNPSVDYIVSVNNFKFGTVNRTHSEIICAGGKGINVSIMLKNLGYESTALGFTAGFTGDEIQRLCTNDGIKTDFIRLNSGTSRINVKLMSEGETQINARGAAISVSDEKKLFKKLDKLADGDILVISGSIPENAPKTIYEDIMEYLKDRNIKIAADTTVISDILKYKPFLIKPNNYELGEIFAAEIKTMKDIRKYAEILHEKGAKNVLVSLGKDGALLVSENGDVFYADAPEGNAVNTVGAGDSMTAGFICGYIESGDYQTALRFGICCGSQSAFSSGFAKRNDVEKLLNKVNISKTGNCNE